MPGLFGPVLWYDMVRTSRRLGMLILRLSYPLLLFVVLYLMYYQSSGVHDLEDRMVNPNVLSELAWSYFCTYMILQWIAVIVLTPVYVGGAIAEEKERRTLEYLFATDLRNREIVLGKLASRLANLIMILLAGIPLLSILQLFGGVPPDLLFGGLAATGLTLLSLGGLSMWCSVRGRTPREALLMTYLAVFFYFLVYLAIVLAWFGIAGFASASVVSAELYTVQSLLRPVYLAVTAGNPFHGLFELASVAVGPGVGGYGPKLLNLLKGYALFHGTLFLVCTTLSVWQVRSAYVRQGFGQALRARPKSVKRLSERLFALDQDPMIWKEIHAPSGSRLGCAGMLLGVLFQLLILVLLAGLFVYNLEMFYRYRGHDLNNVVTGMILIVLPFFALGCFSLAAAVCTTGRKRVFFAVCTILLLSGSMFCYVNTLKDYPAWWKLSDPDHFPGFGDLIRVPVALLGGVIWLVAAVRAAFAVTAEREKQTLDSLLTTLLAERTIIFGKWVGSMFAVRWFVVTLVGLWIIVMAMGSLHPVGLLTAMAVFGIYLAFFTALGIFCGTLARSSLWAGMWAAGLSILLGGAHWFLTAPLLAILLDTSIGASDFFPFLIFGWTPVISLGLAQLQGWEWLGSHPRIMEERVTMLISTISALACTAVGTYLLYAWSVRRFKLQCGRITLKQPPVARPAAFL